MFDELSYDELKIKLLNAIESQDGNLVKKIQAEINERIKKYE